MATKVNPWVTHERLDDEVIAINLETGAYFALAGVAADGWTLFAGGADLDGAVDAIVARYSADRDTVQGDLAKLVSQLEEAGLMAQDDSAGAPPEPLPAPVATTALVYSSPAFERYDDLEDLLLLDPIHEVDDEGWPVQRTEP